MPRSSVPFYPVSARLFLSISDSLSAIDCKVLQSSSFRGPIAFFLAHKHCTNPSYWVQKGQIGRSYQGFRGYATSVLQAPGQGAAKFPGRRNSIRLWL